ncbi:hypothetical protein [Acinetobacter venetianus]|uniref:hypothetical protein n=1 Tax=Acinetobacter venetianus TaxID=52133 RepID=UPI000778285B|nr:hypothetical protein [Acinetobacter venetianus]KXZ67031.1 hypothetical protein AVENLUH7437_00525 [Acinetobacter venetianus]
MENNELAVEIDEMLEEIFHNYLCYFNVEGCRYHQSEYSNQEKNKIFAHMNLNQKCTFNSIILKGSDFKKLLSGLRHLIQNYNEECIKETQVAFKQFMRDYERMGIDYAAIMRPKIKNKVKGIRNMRIRYEKDVYPKLEIFYDLLKEKAKIQGKWSSVNTAVREILPELKNKFLEYDRQQIINKIEANKIYIEENEQLLMHGTDMDFKYYKRHHVQKQQSELVEENRQLEQMLQSNDLSYALKKKSPFNTEYLDEVLMNNLRRNKEIMSLCIINNQK